MHLWIIVLSLNLQGCAVLTKPPGKSFAGPLPAMSHDQLRLSAALRTHVSFLAGEIGERNVWKMQALNQAADYIATNMRAAGYDLRELEYETGGRRVRNLEAVLSGTSRADQIVIIGAHYDTVQACPGANDNATGVAAVLEIARAMATAKPARTVRFVFFVNEEPPFFQTDQMGSMVYAKGCRQRGDKIVAMLAIETIGSYSDDKGSQKYPFPFGWLYPGTGNFIAFVSDRGSRQLLFEVVASFRRHTHFPSEGGAAPRSIPGVGWSDHWAFWQFDYPAIMVTDTAPFRYKHYHLATDTPDKVDFDRAARVVEGLIRVVEDLSGSHGRDGG